MSGESPGSLLSATIVGRVAVLDRLHGLLDESATGGRVVAVAGDAGLGKTRLAKTLAADARARR